MNKYDIKNIISNFIMNLKRIIKKIPTKAKIIIVVILVIVFICLSIYFSNVGFIWFNVIYFNFFDIEECIPIGI